MTNKTKHCPYRGEVRLNEHSGKFATILDEYVYDVSIQGAEEDRSFDDGSWMGIMRDGTSIFKDHDPEWESLNEAEHEVLGAAAGVIIYEHSDGTVEVRYYEHDKDLEAAWAKVMEES